LLAQAIEAEVCEYLAKHADLKTEHGRRWLVRHGHLPSVEALGRAGVCRTMLFCTRRKAELLSAATKKWRAKPNRSLSE